MSASDFDTAFFNVPLQEYIYVKNIPGIDYSPGYVF